MDVIPFIPSDNNYTLRVPLSGTVYLFDTHWNERDQAWYFHLLEENRTPIAIGVKVVLGAEIGKWSNHPFFSQHRLGIYDTSGEGREAGYDDFGTRVVVLHESAEDLMNPSNPNP